ncbi:MAG: twin-arginine translocation signal domain-containing protein, partial [Sphingobacteriaceae bacterium]
MNWNRRDFLKGTSAATLAAMAGGIPLTNLLSSCNSKNKHATADTVILLW